jgi:transcriptional regulator with XRE-family HTH domain
MTKRAQPVPKPQRRRHFIKEWREKRGLSQEQLAERVGKSRGLIGQLETYRINYTAETLEAIAYALQCEPWDLLNVDPSKEGQVIDVMDLLRKATPEQRERAIGYIEGMVRKAN